MKSIVELLSDELNRPVEQIQNVIDLLDDGNTIPFIARYRKEAHGAMDDTLLRTLEERLTYLRRLEERKAEVLKGIEAQGQLTDELRDKIENALILSEVEDLYRPYKPHRRTRATVAKEKGLEPLADIIYAQAKDIPEPEELALEYINPDLGVQTIEDALSGASDIIAEKISDSAELRKLVREDLNRFGYLVSSAAKQEDSVYSLYYEFRHPISKLKDHQILALNRGEREEFLKIDLEIDHEKQLRTLNRAVIMPGTAVMAFLRCAIEDGYTRLMLPSVKNEIRAALTDTAAEGAIHNYALNLKPLLMQPPVRGKVTMGLDPGYRMGCKVAVVDSTGKVLDTTVVYPALTARQKDEAIIILRRLIERHNVEHIAIGNGTASRETEQMTAELIKSCPGVTYMVVSEAGASVYSASKLAAEEFPEYDVNLRSAVSIARRLQDPLAELVKIDPKAVGVGQYQHDMPQKRLEQSLDAVVEDCVNAVGVDLNTASPSLLQRVSGLNSSTAKSIVTYREANGAFKNRKQLLKVPKIGPRAFEQCAGFLRVPESDNMLDRTGVHPESYAAAGKLIELCGFTPDAMKTGSMKGLSEAARQYGLTKAAEICKVGVPTLSDIIAELEKPGRDPRESLPAPIFRTDLLDIKDLTPGMILTGTVRNVVDFGAFVDIGVHQDGLIHISEITDRFIKHPSEVLSVGDDIRVSVLSVDPVKKRIALTAKNVGQKTK